MAWLAVNKDGKGNLFMDKPFRCEYYWHEQPNGCYYQRFIELKKHRIAQLIGRVLTWEDDPVEI